MNDALKVDEEASIQYLEAWVRSNKTKIYDYNFWRRNKFAKALKTQVNEIGHWRRLKNGVRAKNVSAILKQSDQISKPKETSDW